MRSPQGCKRCAAASVDKRISDNNYKFLFRRNTSAINFPDAIANKNLMINIQARIRCRKIFQLEMVYLQNQGNFCIDKYKILKKIKEKLFIFRNYFCHTYGILATM